MPLSSASWQQVSPSAKKFQFKFSNALGAKHIFPLYLWKFFEMHCTNMILRHLEEKNGDCRAPMVGPAVSEDAKEECDIQMDVETEVEYMAEVMKERLEEWKEYESRQKGQKKVGPRNSIKRIIEFIRSLTSLKATLEFPVYIRKTFQELASSLEDVQLQRQKASSYTRKFRSRQTIEEKRREYLKNAEYRRKRAAGGFQRIRELSNKTNLPEDLEANSNGDYSFEIPTEDTRSRIYSEVYDELKPDNIAENVCAVCDSYVPIKELLQYNLHLRSSRFIVDNMVKTLTGPDHLPRELRQQYDCSYYSPDFQGVLLSLEGFETREASLMNICIQCNNALNRKEPRMPKFAIANGFHIGYLPQELYLYSSVEHRMCSPAHVSAITTTLRGVNKGLVAHAMCFEAKPGPFASLLPRNISKENLFQVIICSSMTPLHKILARKAYSVNSENLKNLLKFYMDPEKENENFKGITLSDEWSFDENELFTESEITLNLNEIKKEMQSVSFENEIGNEHIVRNSSVYVTQNDLDCKTARINASAQISVARMSNIQMKTGSWDGRVYAMMFPELFPYGRGHPGEYRQTPASHESCIRHYMNLSSRRFSQHDLFTLVAFDNISKSKAFLGCSLKCKYGTQQFRSQLNQVTSEDLKRALDLEYSLRKTRTLSRHPLMITVGSSLRYMWGSNDERKSGQDKAFATMLRYGNPHIFGTITPNAAGEIAVAYYNGGITIEALYNPEKRPDLDRKKIHRLAANNGHAAAKYFDKLVQVFLTKIIGWNAKTSQPSENKGLFGKVCAYAGATESQGTGNLHLHFLIWLCGHPRTVIDIEKMSERDSEIYNLALAEYTNQILSHSLPLHPTNLECTSCGKSKTLKTKLILEKHRQKPTEEDNSPPKLIECVSCKKEYTSAEINLQLLAYATRMTSCTRQFEYFNTFQEEILKEQNMDLLDALYKDHELQEVMVTTNGRDFRELNDLQRATLITKIVLITNMHKWNHCGSCFKKSSRTRSHSRTKRPICRYLYPKQDVEKTEFKNGKVTVQRRVGSEYINSFNWIIAALFRCNHDIQVLIRGYQECEAIYYMFKYAWKSQQNVDAKAAAALAAVKTIQKRKEQEDKDPNITSEAVARRRLCALAVSTTNKQEIAEPMAALYILRGTPFYFSHEYQPLHLGQWIKFLETGSCTVSLEENQNMDEEEAARIWEPHFTLNFYVHRSRSNEELKEINAYWFHANWSIISMKQNGKDQEFLESHYAQIAKKTLRKNRIPKIPSIIGPRIQDVNQLEDEEDKENFAKIILILFKSFRTKQELLQGEETWWKAYRKTKFDEKSQQIIDNYQNYHELRKKARLYEQETTEGLEQEEINDGKEEHEDRELIDLQLEPNEYPKSNTSDVFNEISEWQRIGMRYPELTPTDRKLSSMLNEISEDLWQTNEVGNFTMCINPDESTIQKDIQTQIVQILPDEQTIMREGIVPNCIVTPRVQPGPIAIHCNLNAEQRAIFIKTANILLDTWNKTSDALQYLGYLGGQGGTGKSTVIQAIRLFAKSWSQTESINLVAFTGKAAALISGKTCHATFGFQNWTSRRGFKMEPQKQVALLRSSIVIIDECSMLGLKDLHRIDAILKWINKEENKPYGGMNVLLTGDFFQLPSINTRYPLYTAQINLKKPSIEELCAADIFHRHVKNSIVLTRNMRQIEDLQWTKECAQARLGNWSENLREMINSRLISNLKKEELSFRGPKENPLYVPIISPNNSTRLMSNQKFMKTVMTRNPGQTWRIMAKLIQSGMSYGLTSADRISLFQHADNVTEGLPGFIDLFVGMPLIITVNVDKDNAIMNGVHVKFSGFVWDEDTEFRTELDNQLGLEMTYPTKQPKALLLQSIDGKYFNFPNLPPDIYPLKPITAKKFTQLPISNERTVSIKFKQFPCICSIGSTVYKIQGESLHKMIIGSWWSRIGSNKTQQGYVIISRVKTLKGLYILEELTRETCNKFSSIPQELLDFEKKISHISIENIAKLQSK